MKNGQARKIVEKIDELIQERIRVHSDELAFGDERKLKRELFELLTEDDTSDRLPFRPLELNQFALDPWQVTDLLPMFNLDDATEDQKALLEKDLWQAKRKDGKVTVRVNYDMTVDKFVCVSVKKGRPKIMSEYTTREFEDVEHWVRVTLAKWATNP